jgi:hypothetical protein
MPAKYCVSRLYAKISIVGEEIVTLVVEVESELNRVLRCFTFFGLGTSLVVEVEVDSYIPVLLHGSLHVAVEECSVGESVVGDDLHFLGELSLTSESETDGGIHHLLSTVLVGEHQGVSPVDLGEVKGPVVGDTSELVDESEMSPDGGFLVDVVLTFESQGGGCGDSLANSVLPSETSRNVSIDNPPLVEDSGLTVFVVNELSGEVGVDEGLSSLTEGFTSVMESNVGGDISTLEFVSALGTNVNLVAVFVVDDTGSFLSQLFHVAGGSSSAVTVVHVHLEDVLIRAVMVLFSFPDDINFLVITLVGDFVVSLETDKAVCFGERFVPVQRDSISVLSEQVSAGLEVTLGSPA